MITVVAAPPFATIQDLGRFGFRDSGVPVSGLADRDSGLALNRLLGNDPNAAMIEWAVAGGVLRFEGDATIAIGGADASCTVNAETVTAWSVHRMEAGSELHVGRILRGRFLLVAVAGGVDVPIVLGSRSTLMSAGFGGFHGRRLRSGDSLPIGSLAGDAARAETSEPAPEFAARAGAPIGITRGPQADLFDDRAWSAFLDTEFTVSRASDRAGYRLDGVTLSHRGEAALPSEPTCLGAIQVPDGGAPIVIMNDGPTVGGYPKIAVIRTSDLSRFAQLAPGATVGFAIAR